jgi:3,4-dihydroxy 2-butanone 4-phosphate synthase / GTP cyclohydrolase II
LGFVTVPAAAEHYRQGRFVIIADDQDRENEGDLCLAAEHVSTEAINFMAREGRGLVCVSLTEERCDELGLAPMVEQNTSSYGTAFTVSVEARGKTTTGISAADRAQTVRTLVDPRTKPHDLLRPGHTFPLRARKGGVLKRAGHTEASIDLARVAGLMPAAVICEILNDDGAMARVPTSSGSRRSTGSRSSRWPTSSATGCTTNGSSSASRRRASRRGTGTSGSSPTART